MQEPPTNLDYPHTKGTTKKKKKKNLKKRKLEEKEEEKEEIMMITKKPSLAKDERIFSEHHFDQLGNLSSASMKALKEMNFSQMTHIQHIAIPAALSGKDVLIKAKTGHGKTLAFGVPLFEIISKNKGQALVIAPTRELALQSKRVLDVFAKQHEMKLVCVIGGQNSKEETRSFKV